MLQGRSARNETLSADFDALRSKLRRAVARYATAALTMLDEDEEEWLPPVWAAVGAIDVMRTKGLRSRTRSTGE